MDEEQVRGYYGIAAEGGDLMRAPGTNAANAGRPTSNSAYNVST